MFDIKPVKEDIYDCFHAAVATIAAHFNRNIDFVFISCLGFRYSRTKQSKICDRINSVTMDQEFNILDLIYGIKIEMNLFNRGSAGAFLKENLNYDIPLILQIDSFICPWHPGFKKYSYKYFVIPITYNEETDSLICLDTYYTHKNESIELNSIHGLFEIFRFRFEDRKIKKDEITNVLCKQLNAVLNSDTYKNIIDFAQDFESFDFLVEFRDERDPINVPLLRKLKYFEDFRTGFTKSLDFLSEHFSIDLDVYKSGFIELAKQWNMVRMLLIKAMIAGNYSYSFRKKCKDILTRTAISEESLLMDLYKFVNNN